MSVRLFIKDLQGGEVHEYGTNQHDSLILQPDGTLSYFNLQTGDGSGEHGSYQFCREDGTDPRDKSKSDWQEEPFVDIGGDYDLYNILSVLRKLLGKEQVLNKVSEAPTTDHIESIIVLEQLIKGIEVVTNKHADANNGEWVYGEFDIPHCSECGREAMPNEISPYCPHCGAHMEDKEE